MMPSHLTLSPEKPALCRASLFPKWPFDNSIYPIVHYYLSRKAIRKKCPISTTLPLSPYQRYVTFSRISDASRN